MTAIAVPKRAGMPDVARTTVSVVLALLALGCAFVLGAGTVAHPPGSGLDAFLLACDLLPLVAAFLTSAFLAGAPQLTGFGGYLAIALVLFVVGATRVDDLLVTMLDAPGLEPLFTVVSCFGFLVVAYLFPNGRFVPSWSRWLLLGWTAAGALALAFPWDAFPPPALAALAPLVTLLVLSLVAAQWYRYVRVSTRLERQQTKWLLLVLGIQAAWFLVVFALPPNTLGRLSEGALAAVTALGSLILTALAVAIGFAMLRYRLFDVDRVIGRALVYAALTGFVLLCYLVVVVGLGLLWPAGTPLALPVVATVVATLGGLPLVRLVQRAVNRRLYGQRDEPAEVLARLGEELATPGDLTAVLDRIAHTLVGALRLPGVGVEAIDDGVRAKTVVGAVPEASAVVIEMSFGGRSVGRMRVAPRAGEHLSSRDLRLLRRLADAAGIGIHSALVAERLRRSRTALVEAREQERRRLHRDLHDGLGPTLSSLHQRIELAERWVDTDPARARALLTGARTGLRGALDEMRALVDALRPAALEHLGLAGAVAEAWSADERIRVVADTALPALPVSVEVSAYRIAMEAVGNAARHSGAARCVATFAVDTGHLVLTVVDDGWGGTARARPGGGLRTMMERAAEAGGELSIADAAPSGTRVVARLPLEPS